MMFNHIETPTTVKMLARDELAAALARQLAPSHAEEAEMLASQSRAPLSAIAGFPLITKHKTGVQWIVFYFFGHGCDPSDRGWVMYSGHAANQEDARAQVTEFQTWFDHIHAPK